MQQARLLHQSSGKPARVFAEFIYQTHKSWSGARRVVAKAEYLDKGENPRFVVTSLAAEEWTAQALYEDFYCARGEMENRIKEQMCMFAHRLSTDEMRGNQLRLYFSALAYTLVEALRRLGLKGTAWAEARVDSIRLRAYASFSLPSRTSIPSLRAPHRRLPFTSHAHPPNMAFCASPGTPARLSFSNSSKLLSRAISSS